MTSTELTAIYAALILADGGIDISAENILVLTNAAAVELEPIWATLLANALKGKDINDMLSNITIARGAADTCNAIPATAVVAKEPGEDPPQDDIEDPDDDLMFPSLWDL